MRLLICVLVCLVACSAGGDDAASASLITVSGKLEHKKLNEASGLARSNRLSDIYWSFNDDGPAKIYALDATGQHLGRVEIEGAKNRDWEDIASFMLDGRAYLVLADIGDNDSQYQHLTLYIVEEPEPEDDTAKVAWEIGFRYPDGPRDAESLAVDAAGGHIYVLSKRTVPAELYRIPLQPARDEILEAEQVAVLDSLPQPTATQRKNAMKSGCGWQPTAMDFAPDGKSALVLTYDGVNYFSRNPEQSWPEVFQGQALHLPISKYQSRDCKNKNAESLSYTDDSSAAIMTLEGKHAPVLLIELLVNESG